LGAGRRQLALLQAGEFVRAVCRLQVLKIVQVGEFAGVVYMLQILKIGQVVQKVQVEKPFFLVW
jgi:hypothetical protein